ncbi:MAG: VWA domain-containing protein [Candidatus Auribacterota bacterium]|jgi:Ca-activated chloride channel family protein|uniref:VWA domain-containing protein n=1 Tax=Candidatus Auribacter fodinae TaxID=2093366 RepID=A0A3A4R8U3_9BACT|nr:MAG: VWA domain-containing protein [Candidatus Auribacter fodinae]
MRFGNLTYLWLIWIIPVLIGFYVFAFKHKKKALALFAHQEVLARLLQWVSFPRQYLKAGMLCTGVLFIILSLIEPKWGYQWQEVRRTGIDIMIALDVSRSMNAADVKPSRIERAKMEISDLLNNLKGDRAGLMVFSGTAFVQCPLTLDYGAFRVFLDQVDTTLVSRGGTDIGAALQRAEGSFLQTENKFKVIILITDGEDLQGNALQITEELQKQGIKIFTIGIGTPEGVPIPVYDDQGNKTYIKDKQGQMVLSKLDETLLQKIALYTGGAYVRGTQAQGLGLLRIYEEKIRDLERRELESTMQKRYENRFQIPLFIGIILIFAEFFVSEKRTVRHEKK